MQSYLPCHYRLFKFTASNNISYRNFVATKILFLAIIKPNGFKLPQDFFHSLLKSFDTTFFWRFLSQCGNQPFMLKELIWQTFCKSWKYDSISRNFNLKIVTWKYMAHWSLVLVCCQCKYSSTFCWAKGSLGYQWLSTSKTLVMYLKMAMDSTNGTPLCSAQGDWKFCNFYENIRGIRSKKWTNFFKWIDFGHFRSFEIAIFDT